MTDKNEMSKKLVAEFTENYMGKLFYFCLKKTGNSDSAEELVQDIALNVISSLNRGSLPENFSAWVWKIARNRYSVWADEKHRRAVSFAAADNGDCEIFDENADIPAKIIHSEQLSLLRRELAFIASDYRRIVLAYYIENQRVRDIASGFSLSESAVKLRLYRARNILKEGMNMARTFGVRSYKPEEISFHFNCVRSGSKNQPYSILGHKLYDNILLESYGNPSSAEELALELGVALPYMENELEFLTGETLLIKKDNKYQTSFPIVSLHAQEQVHNIQSNAAPGITKALTDFLDRLNTAFVTAGFSYYGNYTDYESAKWSLLMLAYDYFRCMNTHIRDFTERPDNGKWDIIGYQNGCAMEPNFVGNHGNGYGIQQFKYEFDGIADRTPVYLTDEEAKTLYGFVAGDEKMKDIKTAEDLFKYGYLRKNGGGYVPDILVLNKTEIKKAFERLDKMTVSDLYAASDKAITQLKNLYDKIAETIKSDLPDIFAENEYMRQITTANSYHARGYIVSEALRSGWLMPAEEVSPSIGAHIFIE